MFFTAKDYAVPQERFADLRQQAARRRLVLAGRRSILGLVADRCGAAMIKLGRRWPQTRISPAHAAPSSLSTVRDP